jgi:hypothetical protein
MFPQTRRCSFHCSKAVLRHRETLRLLWRIALRRAVAQKTSKIKTVAVLRFKGGQGRLSAKDHRTGQFKRLFFDTGQRRLTGW